MRGIYLRYSVSYCCCSCAKCWLQTLLDSSSPSSVIQAAIFLSKSHKISFFCCSYSEVFANKTASSSLKELRSSSRISATLVRVLERCDYTLFERSEGIYIYIPSWWILYKLFGCKESRTQTTFTMKVIYLAEYSWLAWYHNFWMMGDSGWQGKARYPPYPCHSTSKCWGPRQYSQVVRNEEWNIIIYLLDHTQILN